MTLPLRGVRPEPFSAYTTPEFWDDPHISAQMLAHHLDPATAAASRPHAFIDASVDWLRSVLGLGPGSRVLDLGCGPGLYAVRLARRGVRVLGVDASARSLAHARLTVDEVRAEVESVGFDVVEVTGDVAGAPFDPGAPTFAVRAVRTGRGPGTR